MGTSVQREYEPSPWDFVAEQVAEYEASGGREGAVWNGAPVVVLTTVGRHTGKLRKTPVIRFTDGTRYVVVAAQGGAPDHPAWYFNLLADPYVTLQDGDRRRRYVARVAEGEERAAWWAKAAAEYPDVTVYEARTDRTIPVVVLDPIADDGSQVPA